MRKLVVYYWFFFNSVAYNYLATQSLQDHDTLIEQSVHSNNTQFLMHFDGLYIESS